MLNAAVSGAWRILFVAVAVVCFSLIPSSTSAENYWFERYERAVSLIDAGMHDEARAILDRLIVEHPTPIASLRVPGDRYVDYLPYYQRARILLHKGETRSAAHNLDICEAFGAIQKSRQSEENLKSLREQIVRVETAQAGKPKPAVAAVGTSKK